MALSGELSDLSLAELIEFFCNQRKTGRLKVIYPTGPGYFYLQSGAVVHAKVGALRGIDAVYYALTLPNASFRFSAAFEPPERTINQPWTSVVLEGLRRMDEGVVPSDPFPEDYVPSLDDSERLEQQSVALEDKDDSVPAFVPPAPVFVPPAPVLEPPAPVKKPPTIDRVVSAEALPWLWEGEAHLLKKPWGLGAAGAAVILILLAIGVPWGWYARKSARAMNQPKTVEVSPQDSIPAEEVKTVTEPTPTASPAIEPNFEADAAVASKRWREARARERAKQQTASANDVSAQSTTAKTPATSSGPRKVTVQVSYDENGRVTQASGGDATALRIARQKRFPAGKAGSATITIPIN
jgi:Domain of unknown function (DUF4388)